LTYKAIPQKDTGLMLNGDVKDILKINNQVIFGINNGTLKSYLMR
jgi:enediyne biosynthesis protein E4